MTLKEFNKCIKDIGGEEDNILILKDTDGHILTFKIVTEDDEINIIIS